MLIEITVVSSVAYALKKVWSARKTLPEKEAVALNESDSVVQEGVTAAGAIVTPQRQGMLQEGRRATQLLGISIASTVCAVIGAFGSPVLTALGLAGAIFVGRDAFINGFRMLFHERKLGVDMLSTLAHIMLAATGHFLFNSLGILNYAINRKLLTSIKSDSKQEMLDVFQQHPRFVWIMIDGAEVEVPFESLKIDDIVVVDTGHTVPVDGVIIEGTALIDQHVLTGESQPVEKSVGEHVLALTIVLSGRVYVQVEKAGSETTAANIAEIYNQTADVKLNMQLKTEELSGRTVMPTFIAGGISLFTVGTTASTAILAAHFKYRATIVTSVAILKILSQASKKGILIKDGRTLELLNQVDTVVFDKTGTLTQEEPYVGVIYAYAGYSEQEVLLYAAMAETKQAHPIAKAIISAAQQYELVVPEVEEANYSIGFGITVNASDKVIRVGSARFITREGIAIPEVADPIQAQCYQHGYSLIFVAIDDCLIGMIELRPTLRKGADSVVTTLKQQYGQSTYIISGDHDAPTKKIAHDLGIDHYFAEALPERKAELIEQLQQEGKTVCYIGDGINDAVALKKATVSISLSGATSIAVDTAQIVLMDEDLENLPYLFELSQQLEKNIKTTFSLVIGSSFLTMGGALFLHFGLLMAFLIPQLGMMAGIGNSMMPLKALPSAKNKQGNAKKIIKDTD